MLQSEYLEQLELQLKLFAFKIIKSCKNINININVCVWLSECDCVYVFCLSKILQIANYITFDKLQTSYNLLFVKLLRIIVIEIYNRNGLVWSFSLTVLT